MQSLWHSLIIVPFTKYTYGNKPIEVYVRLMKLDFIFAIQYVISNRKFFKLLYGNTIINELILNYRSRITKDGTSLIKDIKKYLLPKNRYHKSDLMIAFNVLNCTELSFDDKEFLIDFMITRLLPAIELDMIEFEQLSKETQIKVISEKSKKFAEQQWIKQNE